MIGLAADFHAIEFVDVFITVTPELGKRKESLR
jgi:hypothetical protein